MKELSKYKSIVVSGCQRSGTTILTKMIAHTLGYTKLDEFQLDPHNLENLQKVMNGGGVVIHSPQLSSQLHQIAVPDSCVVWINRSFNEVRKSMQRIGWQVEEEERKKYERFSKVAKGVNINQSIERVKYDFWQWQKQRMKVDWIEHEYESDYMRSHELFRNIEQRKDFNPKQTSEDNRSGRDW